MSVWVLILVLFLAPDPKTKDVEVRTSTLTLASPEQCVVAQNVVNMQARQDPKVLDFAVSCIKVTGKLGTDA